MSFKNCLGLEDSGLSEVEIMTRIFQARRRNQDVVEFSCNGRVIRVNLCKLSPDGIMKGDFEYYAK